MTVVLLVGLVWTLLSIPVAVVIGRGVRLADRDQSAAPWTDDVERYLRAHAGTQRSTAGPDSAPAR